MDPDRFAALAGAFGGDLGRWPWSEREAAHRLAAAQPALAERWLGDARRLDRTLDAAPAISASHRLRERIVGAAPRPRAPRPRAVGMAWRWLAGLGLTAGLAAAAAGGVTAAIGLAPITIAPPRGAPASDPVEEAALLLREPSEPGEA